MSIAYSALDVGASIGIGGQAEVFLVNNRPGQAFKRYQSHVLPKLRADVLEELAAETRQLTLEARPITYWATWPTETVVHGGHVVGFLMPLLDPTFSMSEGNLKGKHASFSYLATKPAPAWGQVRLPNQGDRVRLLALLAGVLQQLHHRHMVVGDLSWTNVLWARSPDLRVILLDCDGIRPPKGIPVSDQLDSPDWDDPCATPYSAPDADRDCYKLSLMVLRVLSQDLNAEPSPLGGHHLPGVASEAAQAIDALLVRSAAAPGKRPTATQWRHALQGRPVQEVTVPVPRPDFKWSGGQPAVAVGSAERKYQPVIQRPEHPQPPVQPTPPISLPSPERRWRSVETGQA